MDAEPTVTNIGADLRTLLSEKINVPLDIDWEQQILFDPERYKGKEQELLEEGKALDDEQLIDYAKMVTELRASINNKAESMEAVDIQRGRDEVGSVNADDIKLRRTYTPLKKKKIPEFKHQGVESGMRPDLQKKLKLP